MTEQRYQRVLDVLRRRQPDLTVVMDNVHKRHNLAAVIRTCDAVGIPEVHAISSMQDIRLAQRAAAGTKRWVDVNLHNEIPPCFSALKDQGFTILAAHFDENAVSHTDVDYTRPTALVIGAELEGISEESLSRCDGSVVIPMQGLVRSLNVSVACALILFEAMRQRELAGMYDEASLSEEVIAKKSFEWMHPVVADYCQRNGLPYPAMDDEGFIAEALADRLPDAGYRKLMQY